MRKVLGPAVILLLLCSQTTAQMVPAMDFARHPEIADVRLSPTGEYVALAVPTADGMETQLQILKLDGSGKTQVLRFGKMMHVNDLVWTADDRITVSRAKMEPLKARPISTGELMSSDVEGKHQETLFAYIEDDGTKRGKRKDEGFAKVEKVLDSKPGTALVSFNCWSWTCPASTDGF